MKKPNLGSIVCGSVLAVTLGTLAPTPPAQALDYSQIAVTNTAFNSFPTDPIRWFYQLFGF
jgi:hypothetical protein